MNVKGKETVSLNTIPVPMAPSIVAKQVKETIGCRQGYRQYNRKIKRIL